MERFWRQVWPAASGFSFWLFDAWTKVFSPYQFNPLDFNPLRDMLCNCIDFEELVRCDCVELFISATNVRTGQVRVFRNEEITPEVVLASTCLPFYFQAVEIGGEHYWDGGYMGNPSLFPLFYYTQSRDMIIVHINPIEREEIPTTAMDIGNRLNEITFNSSLLKELRAIAFVVKLLEEKWIRDEHRGRAQARAGALDPGRRGAEGPGCGHQIHQQLGISHGAARPGPRDGGALARGELQAHRQALQRGHQEEFPRAQRGPEKNNPPEEIKNPPVSSRKDEHRGILLLAVWLLAFPDPLPLYPIPLFKAVSPPFRPPTTSPP